MVSKFNFIKHLTAEGFGSNRFTKILKWLGSHGEAYYHRHGQFIIYNVSRWKLSHSPSTWFLCTLGESTIGVLIWLTSHIRLKLYSGGAEIKLHKILSEPSALSQAESLELGLTDKDSGRKLSLSMRLNHFRLTVNHPYIPLDTVRVISLSPPY